MKIKLCAFVEKEIQLFLDRKVDGTLVVEDIAMRDSFPCVLPTMIPS